MVGEPPAANALSERAFGSPTRSVLLFRFRFVGLTDRPGATCLFGIDAEGLASLLGAQALPLAFVASGNLFAGRERAFVAPWSVCTAMTEWASGDSGRASCAPIALS